MVFEDVGELSYGEGGLGLIGYIDYNRRGLGLGGYIHSYRGGGYIQLDQGESHSIEGGRGAGYVHGMLSVLVAVDSTRLMSASSLVMLSW